MPKDKTDNTADAENDEKPAAKRDQRRQIGPRTGNADADKSKPIRRSQIAVNVVAQILFALLIFGMMNYLNFRHHKRWDLTENQKYTVDGETAGYLSSLEDEVKITMAFLSSSKIHQNLKALLEEYRRLSKGKIKLDVFDPARDRDRATTVAQKYMLSLSESTVILDVGGKIVQITEDEMIEDDGRLFRGEDAITSALISATEGGEKKIYLISGHGQLRSLDDRTALNELNLLSQNQFFKVETLSLSDVQEIPRDADALFILGASLDFSEREIGIIRRFWEADDGALFVMLKPEGGQVRTPNLRKFLASYGVDPQPDRVIDTSGTGMKSFDVQGRFRSESPINRSLAGSNTTFLGQTCSLRLTTDNVALARAGLGLTVLVEANERFWGEYDYTAERPVLNPSDNGPPVIVAASVEKGAIEGLSLETSRMVVIGNSSLLDPDHLMAGNVRFIVSGLNWILDREKLIGIPAKTATAYRIEITESQHIRMFRLAIFVLPGIVFVLGLLVWSIRRA